jgi:hypothetical protein
VEAGLHQRASGVDRTGHPFADLAFGMERDDGAGGLLAIALLQGRLDRFQVHDFHVRDFRGRSGRR